MREVWSLQYSTIIAEVGSAEADACPGWESLEELLKEKVLGRVVLVVISNLRITWLWNSLIELEKKSSFFLKEPVMRIISLELNASFDFSLTAGNRQWREQTMGRNQADEGYLEMILSYSCSVCSNLCILDCVKMETYLDMQFLMVQCPSSFERTFN